MLQAIDFIQSNNANRREAPAMSPNRSAIIMVLLIGFVFLFVGCGSNDVEKAKEFMAAGMYPQAIELLNKRIQEKPDDAEAHFQLGVCLINTGSFRMADERFASAVRLKPDYGFQIGGEYKNAGMQALEKNDFLNAQNLFDKAVSFQPDLKDEIVKFCVEKGTALLDKGTTQNTDSNTSETDQEKSINILALAGRFDKTIQTGLLQETLISYYGQEKPETRANAIKKFSNLMSTDTKKALEPKLTWQVVPGSEIELVGKGMGPKDYLEVPINKWLSDNCKVAIKAENDFSYYFGGKFVSGKKYGEYPVKFAPKKPLGVKLPKGEKGIMFVLEKTYN